MVSCTFCDIAAGAEPASFVYQDEEILGILSLDQPNLYKVMVLPRAHVESIFDMSEDLAAALFRTVPRIARAVRDASGCSGLNIVQSNGAAAGQEVRHFHMHLLPRTDGDQIELSWPSLRVEREKLDSMAAEVGRYMRQSEGE